MLSMDDGMARCRITVLVGLPRHDSETPLVGGRPASASPKETKLPASVRGAPHLCFSMTGSVGDERGVSEGRRGTFVGKAEDNNSATSSSAVRSEPFFFLTRILTTTLLGCEGLLWMETFPS